MQFTSILLPSVYSTLQADTGDSVCTKLYFLVLKAAILSPKNCCVLNSLLIQGYCTVVMFLTQMWPSAPGI